MEHRWISAGILCWWNLSITLECKLCHLGEFYSLGKCITREEGSLTTSYSSWQPLSAATAAKLHQLCPTLCDPIDSSPRGSPIPGILQARTLEWVAISFSSAWKWKVKVKSLSRVRLIATPWTATYQAPPSMGFSRQEYWSGVPLPSPRYFLFVFNFYCCATNYNKFSGLIQHRF